MLSDREEIMERFNQDYDANFSKLRKLVENWVRKVPHSKFLFFTDALNEYFENDKSYTTSYAKRVFLSWLREAENCRHIHDLFSKLGQDDALKCLLCSKTALDNRFVFFPLMMTLGSDSDVSGEELEKISFVYSLPEKYKASDLVSCDDSEPLQRYDAAPEDRFWKPEYDITGCSMVMYNDRSLQ